MNSPQVLDRAIKQPIDLKVVTAFFAIYILWGSTFLAIRVTVLLMPPWLAAGIRFFAAGILLYAFMRLRGTPGPTPRQWRNLAILGLLMFSMTYGALFWGEQFVPSGITAVLEATLPLITVLLEVFVFRQQKFRWMALFAVTLGFCGVVLMLFRGSSAGHPLNVVAILVILGGSVAWSLGSVSTRSLELPQSRPLTAGAEMMLGGALLLLFSAMTGEWHNLRAIPPKAIFALLYLITAGSIVGFTAFVWLLGRMPASRVASHAYVNPIVALALGHLVAGEEITLRIVAGTALVIGSVFLTMRPKA